MYLMGDKIIP